MMVFSSHFNFHSCDTLVCLTDRPYICHLPFGYDWGMPVIPLRASLCWESALGCILIYYYIIAINWVIHLPKWFRFYNQSTCTVLYLWRISYSTTLTDSFVFRRRYMILLRSVPPRFSSRLCEFFFTITTDCDVEYHIGNRCVIVWLKWLYSGQLIHQQNHVTSLE
jgi:hypothetical protein